MSCIISAGMPAVPACARTRRIRTWSGAIWSCRASTRRASTFSIRSPIRASRRIVKVIEPETLAQRAGYAAPHTVHCGPDGIFMSALGAPDGNGPGGTFILDPETFDIRGRWELDRGPQKLAYDVWWHLGLRHDDHEHVGHAQHGEGRREPRDAARRQVRQVAARVGPAPPASRAGARRLATSSR